MSYLEQRGREQPKLTQNVFLSMFSQAPTPAAPLSQNSAVLMAARVETRATTVNFILRDSIGIMKRMDMY